MHSSYNNLVSHLADEFPGYVHSMTYRNSSILVLTLNASFSHLQLTEKRNQAVY